MGWGLHSSAWGKELKIECRECLMGHQSCRFSAKPSVMIPTDSNQGFLFWNTPAPLRGIPRTPSLLLAFPIRSPPALFPSHSTCTPCGYPFPHTLTLSALEGYHHPWTHWVLVPNDPTPEAGYCCSIPQPLCTSAVPVPQDSFLLTRHQQGPLLSVDRTSSSVSLSLLCVHGALATDSCPAP